MGKFALYTIGFALLACVPAILLAGMFSGGGGDVAPFLLGLLAVVCLGAGIGMETISKWGPWMDLVSIYIIPIGATLGAVSWFFIMKKDDLLAAVNTGSGKHHGALWYNVGRFVYVPLAALLCGVALIAHVAF